jgi:[lysine-biosynthesis-protein LysW]--L-2-aminoadipate ligase
MTAAILVLASRVRTEEKRIFEALERRAVPYTALDARTLWAWPDGGADDTVLLNRELSYSRAVQAARTFEAQGMTVVNSAAATETCGDKWRTTLALTQAGLPVPRTALALTPQAGLDALAEIGYPAVLKPLVGSWGRLVAPVPDPTTAQTLLEYVAALPGPMSHLVYVQRRVMNPGRDIRVAVIGGESVGASYREAETWRTNVARGAVTTPCTVTHEIDKLAVGAATAVGADICGVDLIEDEDGALWVLEVNHGLEFTGLQRALGETQDVADRIVDHLLVRAQQ